MAFAKKLFFTALFLSILMEAEVSSVDPWAGIGWYFHADLQSWLPLPIALTPFEITMIIIFIAWALRGRRNRRFHFERGLLFWPIVAFGSLLFWSLLWGTMQPGSNFTIGLWEIRSLAYSILVYFLVGILFTHRRDLSTLTWVILISTLLLSIEGLIRYEFLLPGHVVSDSDYDHEDAILLASVIILSVAMLLLGSTRRQKWFIIVTLPIEVLGLMVTYRRAGEAALIFGLAFLAVILLRVNKSLFLKIVPVTALIFAIYLGAEWNCTHGALCQPARAISSQFNPDPRDAASDNYRLAERYDLTLNIEANPITGLGFGQPFVFYVPLPDLSFWPFWHYTPHDEIIWIWVKMGMFGFMAFWWLIGSALYRSGRLTQTLSAAGDYQARALLATAACLIVMQMAASYVDLGLTSDRAMLMFGIMLGVIGHLPEILRRATNTDRSVRSARSVDDQLASTLAKETPEVQAGILAQALISPHEPANSSSGSSWSQRQAKGKRGEPRWSQAKSGNGNQRLGESGVGRTSRPLTGARQPHKSRPLWGDQSNIQPSARSGSDELPWATHSRE